MTIEETKTLKTTAPDFKRAHTNINLSVTLDELMVIGLGLNLIKNLESENSKVISANMMHDTIVKHTGLVP